MSETLQAAAGVAPFPDFLKHTVTFVREGKTYLKLWEAITTIDSGGRVIKNYLLLLLLR